MPPPIPLKPLPPYMGGWQGFELPGEEKLAVLQLMPLLLRHGGLLGFLLEFAWEGEGQKCEGGGKGGGGSRGVLKGAPPPRSTPPPHPQAARHCLRSAASPGSWQRCKAQKGKGGGGRKSGEGGGNPALLQHSSPLGGRGAQPLYSLGGGFSFHPTALCPPPPVSRPPPPSITLRDKLCPPHTKIRGGGQPLCPSQPPPSSLNHHKTRNKALGWFGGGVEKGGDTQTQR